MPAPAIVTPATVAQAVVQLAAAGEPITGWRLRRIIGSGNPARLEAVAREQAAAEAPDQPAPEPEAPALPPAIAEHLAEAETRVLADLRGLIGQAWARASDLASRRVAGEVEAARARGAELEAELAEAAVVLTAADERADVQAGEVASLQGALAKASKDQEEAQRAAQDATSRLEEVRAALAAAERRADVTDARLVEMLAALRPALALAPAPVKAAE